MIAMFRCLACCSLLACVLACAGCSGGAPFSQLAGVLLDSAVGETSGLAASRIHPDVLWLQNDSGSGPELYAVSRRGRVLARYVVDGVANTDWEDLAAFDLDGRHYLLIADTGDNGGLRKSLQLHVVEEPDALADGHLAVAWSIAFRWPDGPHDCEAVAVDARAGQVLLVTKKRRPPMLFALPLRPRGTGLQVAHPLGPLAGVPRPTQAQLDDEPTFGRLIGQITAADLSPDGRTLAVMTYQDLLLYRRRGDEPWAAAVARAPQRHALPWLHQAEALGWTSDGNHLYASGEVIPAPIYLLDPKVISGK